MNTIHPAAVIFDNVELGDNNVIGANAVLGWEGAIRGAEKFEGKLVIGDGNYIGANTVICVGTEGITKIGNGNIIMNLTNIGHNSTIGDGNEIGAGSIIAGHVHLGDNNRLKLNCTVRNRVTIQTEIIVGMGSVVTKDLITKGLYYGNPAKWVRGEY